jgi:hypothetical protein
MFTDEVSRFPAVTGLQSETMDTQQLESQRIDLLDDVFGGESDGEHLGVPRIGSLENSSTRQGDDVSDIPRLQGIHSTNGYRDGIAATKEKFLQEGFDEGYALGAEIGAAAGKIVGLLESLAVTVGSGSGKATKPTEVVEALSRARTELSAKSLYDQEYFGEDGIWKYEVTGDTEGSKEDNVTFRLVASCHPLIRKWSATVNGLLDQSDLKRRNL